MTARKKTGRPLKDHAPDEMVTIGVQVSGALKAELQKRAEAANRSLSQEVVLALRRETEPPVEACNRMFGGGEAGFCAGWVGQVGMFVQLMEASPTKVTIYKEHLDRVKAFLRRIEAKATVVSGKGSDNE
jgi:hypothetical protein